MATKPEHKQIKSLIKQAQAVDNRLKEALYEERNEVANLRLTADAF